MNAPSVEIDNDSNEHATVIKVDSANRHGILLEVVQFLTDLNFIITKAYISSFDGWFMDVFHVTDHKGNKVRDAVVLNSIHDTLETGSFFSSSLPFKEYTSIELSGNDRPDLMSEVSAVLALLGCNVVNTELLTHNNRAVAVFQVIDESAGGGAIENPKQLSLIKILLWSVFKGDSEVNIQNITISSSGEVTHTRRRLHQMMFAERDFQRLESMEDKSTRPIVTTLPRSDRNYTFVTINSQDRPKLLFDTVCALTDMQYVVFHATVVTGGIEAYQEYYIRDIYGSPIKSEAEGHRLSDYLEAIIGRRASELEICACDSFGLLSDITKTFQENGLWIRRAEISINDGKARNTFFVTDVIGNPVQAKTVKLVRQQLEHINGKWNRPQKNPQKSTKSLVGKCFTFIFALLILQMWLTSMRA